MNTTDIDDPAGENSDTQVRSATASATPSATATSEPTPEPTELELITPTADLLPDRGAEFEIEDQPVTRIIPADDTGRTLYAVTSEGLWRTNDGGVNWDSAGEAIEAPAIAALNEPNIVYAGDKGDCGRGMSSYDFQRTTDAGRNWETITANADIQPLLAYESEEDGLLFGTNCGLSLSTDGGDSWENIQDLAGEEIFGVVTDRSSPLEHILVVAVTEGGMGRLFLLDTQDPRAPDLIGAINQFFGSAALDWRSDRIVVATVAGVGVTDDLGGTWNWTRSGLESVTLPANPLEEDIPIGAWDPFPVFNTVVIDPQNIDRVWIGSNLGAFQSNDGGETWERLGAEESIQSIAISHLTKRVFVSGEGTTRIWALDDN